MRLGSDKKAANQEGQELIGDSAFDSIRCRTNMAHVRRSRPDSGHGFQVEINNKHQGVPFSLGSGLDVWIAEFQARK